MRYLAIFLVLVFGLPNAVARGVYQPPQDFIQESFGNDPPPPEIFWITQKLRPDIEKILGHKPSALRTRYWSRAGRTAWILDEIGKEKPITAGIVIREGRIERLKVLIFRESRGWEVRHAFFTDQFNGLRLMENNALDQNIDGISGATLSVRALKKLARLALYLDRQVSEATPTDNATPP